MDSFVTLATRDGVGIITINNPPVNALSHGVPEGIETAIHAANADPAVRAIVIIGGGRTFVAGADINELEKAAYGKGSLPDLHPMLYTVEDSAKPVVMAIHGTALGGGLELAMAGHYRVATADAQLGLPETKLGILPGAGGTQRLPRLVGTAKAAEMCATGDPIPAQDALAAGLVDRVIHLETGGDLLAGAIAFAQEAHRLKAVPPKTRDRVASAAPLEALREQIKKTRRHQIAPLAVIDAVEAAASLSFEAGIQREKEIFQQLGHSDQAKALMHAFFGERTVAKVPGLPKDTAPYPVKSVAIVGAGTMGGGIAMAFANAGFAVRLNDASPEALERGMAVIRKNYEASIKRGRLTPEAMSQRLERVGSQTGLDGFDQADLIVEAVFESLALKKQVFAELDRVAKPDCVLATNTSTLDVDAIAQSTSRPHMVVGLHFFSPANVMRLVEVVRGSATEGRVLATAMAVAKALKKVGVVVRNGFGFVGNRMMFPYMFEAQFLVEEGATPEQVDAALTDFGMAMGIFGVDDMAGIDVMWRVKQEFKDLLEPRGKRAPLVADKLYQMGRYGQKTGAGWYRYEDGRKATADPAVLELIRTTAAEAGIKQREISTEEIVERCVYALINEGARVLEEGRAARAVDIDIVYLTGYGFPAWRGGPMFHAGLVGLERIYQRLCEFEKEHGERWKPAPLLARLAAEKKTFADFDAERE
ncbi:MAG TPA: 3-hydroxyacyl-CoA dehydrogenase NAD-binding domain-containing protein [Bryobacteraceae bacterium]|nr:3-hydroxyacyl-CoA dehydrogenase NAD-binding domain-containing protein [Bryobacteraceae bacterium]